MLVERHMFTVDVTPKGLRRLIRQVGVELIFDLLDLRRADVAGLGMGNSTDDIDQFENDIKTEIESKAPFSLRDLAINGNDLMEMFDLKQGKEVGDILDYLMEKVLDNPQENNKEKLEKLSKVYYNENINTSNNKELN
jgi:tRNA nucleotidyltransferase (CCA-adding enzyme)